MEYPPLQIFEPAISERDFTPILQLVAGPPSPLHVGLGDWRQMYRMASDCGDSRGAAVALRSILSTLASSGQATEAIVCAHRLITIGQEINDPLIVGHGLNALAWTNWVLGDHVSAGEEARKAMRFAIGLHSKPLLHSFAGPEAIKAGATELLLKLKHARRGLRRGVADHEAMPRIHRENGGVLQAINAMEGMGLVYNDLGETEKALEWLSAALQSIETVDHRDPRGSIIIRAGLLGNLAVVYTKIGDTEEALRLIQEKFDIYSRLSDDFGKIGAHGQKGRALLQAGRISESLHEFDLMLQLARQQDAQAWQQAAHFNLARALVSSGDRSHAAVHCENAVELARAKTGYAGVDLCWLRAILFLPARIHGESDGSNSALFIALAYYAFEALHQEVRSSKPTVVVEQWIDEFEVVIHAALLLPPTKPLCDLPMHSPSGETAPVQAALESIGNMARNSPFIGWLPLDIGLYCLESFRAQEFQERLLLDAADLEITHDQQIVGELAAVEAELAKLQKCPPIVITGTTSFDDAGRLVPGERASEESIAAQERTQQNYLRRVAELNAARDVLAMKTIQSNEATETAIQQPVRLSDIRDALREDEMFLEFVLLGQSDGKRKVGQIVSLPSETLPDGAFVIAITRSWMEVVPLGKTVAIETKCRRLLDIIDRFWSSLSFAFFQVEAHQIFELLLRPIWSRAAIMLNSVRHLVLATDGVLNLLPLDLLVDEMRPVRSWCEVDYLARRFSTEYTPSATVFVDLRLGRYQRGEPGRTFVGFGDPAYALPVDSESLRPLPATRREIEGIATLVTEVRSSQTPRPVRTFLGADAKKENLCDPQILKDAEHIHLACHGSAGRAPYFEGALFLTPEDSRDPACSVLTAREVLRLRTSAKLVVMSACESGLGKLTRGEGIQGLVRAWLFAGASSAIATLWQVDDVAAAELMKSLYRFSFSSSVSTAEDLAAVKRAAMDNEELACPVHWAAFAIFGGRPGLISRQRDLVTPAKQSNSTDHSSRAKGATTNLDPNEREVLEECGRAWESAWRTISEDDFRAFFHASRKLSTFMKSKSGVTYEFCATATLGLVAKNCRIAWQHWTKERRASLAVGAYREYVLWQPSAASDDWDALVSAYRVDNVKRVRSLTRQKLLPREFEMSVNDSLHVSITSTIKDISTESETTEILEGPPLEIALPVDDPDFKSESANFTHCRSLGWIAFPLGPGDCFRITEKAVGAIHTLDDDTFVLHGIWGSRIFPHILTIHFHSDYIPLRFQRQQMGKSHSNALVRFGADGASVLLRPTGRPWLERIAVMFRRIPGASALFGAANSPFTKEMAFEEFERLMQQAQRRQP